MKLEQARFNMIEQQIRPWNVLDMGVLELLTIVKREKFLPTNQKSLAFMDTELPLPDGSLMLSPKMEARIVQEVAVKKHESALIVGAGSGYLPALLAFHARHVTCVETSPEVHLVAEQNLHHEGVANVSLELGDAAKGWPKAAPYDVIVMTGSLQVLPEELKQQLKVGGRLFVILGSAPIMTAFIYTRSSETEFVAKPLFETSIAAVPHAEHPSTFSF
ncbi:protein-L-isoaspartate O-methyltransferase family protein [Solimicrobium silvestre]|uniref:Protein-L-isoaspartate O-methyltransferase n=1 Tax=Solimicrobium silvestre TaxID=2099400 RepID=A0A2S9GXK7_9BURK|nr:protein-L-isoaspartate O-methyltransferase [Solimicrobium silvestre]PRC92441.1 Protein-L-isoaspartate carboxylmethyltransferase [Solimicrobium silvestre]